MLHNYFSQLKKLAELLGHGRGMDFHLYLETLKVTAIILLQSIGFLIGLATFAVLPFYIKRRINIHFNALLKKAVCETTDQVEKSVQCDKIIKQRTYANILYWVVLALVYIPFAIPTVLLFL